MAKDTKKALRNQVMYSVFVRQYSKEGTFRKLQEDLPRIRSLGVDIIWLMPIHPIGEKSRKGTLGSPYAIQDYRAVNPEFGTREDFVALVKAIHDLGMKCIIDVVYNHTSPDSVLSVEHPEWFYHKADGSFGNRIGDWSDIIDLDYANRDLWDYQIETLKMWAEIVDGFRCDVAPLIPLDFWLAARKAVEQVRPGCIWLSESVEPAFTLDNRARGMTSLSDAEIFQAFDLSYEYDVYHDWIRYLTDEISLSAYLEKLSQQEYLYPENYVKLRFLENHDRPRARFCVPDERARRNWTAFSFFQKGMTLIYNGQETENIHRPSLFDKDDIQWHTGHDISDQLRMLSQIKHQPLLAEGSYSIRDGGNDIIIAEYAKENQRMIGLFGAKGKGGLVRMNLPDGSYRNLLGGSEIHAESGLICFEGQPQIFIVRQE